MQTASIKRKISKKLFKMYVEADGGQPEWLMKEGEHKGIPGPSAAPHKRTQSTEWKD